MRGQPVGRFHERLERVGVLDDRMNHVHVSDVAVRHRLADLHHPPAGGLLFTLRIVRLRQRVAQPCHHLLEVRGLVSLDEIEDDAGHIHLTAIEKL